MENYKDKLTELYNESLIDACVPPSSKLEYIGGDVFDFTTYDGEMDSVLAKTMLDVLECILNKSTFEFQKDRQNYINYIVMVNMPFLKDKLEWGTSIRGAWFDEYGHHSDKEPREYKIGITGLKIPKKDINIFIKDLIEWSKN